MKRQKISAIFLRLAVYLASIITVGALLFVVSLLVGERMGAGALWTYGPIWLALLMLGLEGLRRWRAQPAGG